MTFTWVESAEFALKKYFDAESDLRQQRNRIEAEIEARVKSGETDVYDRPRGRRCIRVKLQKRVAEVQFALNGSHCVVQAVAVNVEHC